MVNFSKDIFILMVCQSVLMLTQSIMFSSAPWIGLTLTNDKSLTSLPIGIQFGAALATIIPAAFIMKRLGFKAGFMFGSACGTAGCLLSFYGIFIGSFLMFCCGLALQGILSGFATYYRFAAAEIAGIDHMSKGVSHVFFGGVIAAFIGPTLADYTINLVGSAKFSGGYLVLTFLNLLAFISLVLIHIPKYPLSDLKASRPMSIIIKQPVFIVAVLCAMLCSGIMNLFMTASAISMHDHHFSFSQTAFLIQWHMLGMFLPSIFCGKLIFHFGIGRIMQIGATLMVICLMMNIANSELWVLWLAMVALGIGWNFLFVGSTSLLIRFCSPHENSKIQAFNEFFVLLTVTATSLLAGFLNTKLGWIFLNISAIPFLIFILISVFLVTKNSICSYEFNLNK
jgi:MFS family permease